VSVWSTVYKKELRETLRDRRTLAIMILLPLVLYPLMSVLAAEWFISHETSRQARKSKVVLAGPGASSEDLRRALEAEGSQIELEIDADRRVDPKAGVPALGEADAIVVAPARAGEILAGDDSLELSVYYDRASDESDLAETRVATALEALADRRMAERLAEENLPEGFVKPIALARVSLASRAQVGRHEAAKTLPFVIVLMVLMGAFYPAIDMTAGEKERGTLEPLLATPAPRRSILAGKLLTVATISALTGLLNLVCMAGAALWIARSATRASGTGLPLAEMAAAVPWGGVALGLVALMASTLLFSGLLMAVAAMARGFKEAQNFLTPVYLVATMPAMASWLPGTELSYGAALIPVANVTLLFKDAVAGSLSAGPAIVALLASASYAAAALAFASRVYDSERLLFAPDDSEPREQKTRWWKRPRPVLPAGRPVALPPGEALALFAVCAILLLGPGGELQALGLLGLAASLFLCLALPVLLFARLRLGDAAWAGLGARPPSPRHVAAAVLVGASGWLVLASLVLQVQERLFPTPKALNEALEALIAPDESLAVKLFAVAIAPAIAEELLCRGALLRGLRVSLGDRGAIVISALLFAVLHASAYRFVPTFLLGLVLGVTALRTGLFGAMIVHALNNGVVVLLGELGGTGSSESPPWWAGPLSLAVLSGGFALMLRPKEGEK
jgi:sodium transport system permease protein